MLITHLICFIWKVDLVVDCWCLLLDGLHLYVVRRVLSLSMSAKQYGGFCVKSNSAVLKNKAQDWY